MKMNDQIKDLMKKIGDRIWLWDWEAGARAVMRRKMSACQYCLSQREDQ